VLKSLLNEGGRGMELSDLSLFHGDKLLRGDDRTGVIYWIDGDEVVPLYILRDGNGRAEKGFKIEWMTVKDGLLCVGSMGKEWTKPSGEFQNNDPLWIKTIDGEGRVSHVDWHEEYNKLRRATGTENPGYLLHEAVAWNPVLRRWFFFPRRMSFEQYDDVKDEERGSNVVLSVDETFADIKKFTLGPHIPTRGFSSVVFLPGREHEVVALKSEEFHDIVATYITVFDISSNTVLLAEDFIAHEKYEGVEIL